MLSSSSDLKLLTFHLLARRDTGLGADDRMHAPALVVGRGMIQSKMRAARFFPPERGAGDERRDRQKVVRRKRERRTRDLIELEKRAPDRILCAEDADALPHQASDALAHRERDRAAPALLGL